MENSSGSQQGPVTCGSWIRRPENLNLVVLGRSCPSLVEIFPFNAKTSSLSTSPLVTFVVEVEEGDPVAITVHPRGDDFVCSFSNGSCNMDSKFLASTSTDGLARIWKTKGVPMTTLSRNSDEMIELCRFSKDGTKPFLFCTIQKGDKAVIAVWDISAWNKIGYKKLLKKPTTVMSISHDGKYLALGSKDGDISVIKVKKMEVCHYSKRLHLGTYIAILEFCPRERVVLTTLVEWGAQVTKLNVPTDWKDWQIYLLLLGLFLASAVVFYIFHENSDSFWKFPLGPNQSGRLKFKSSLRDPQFSNDHHSCGSVEL